MSKKNTKSTKPNLVLGFTPLQITDRGSALVRNRTRFVTGFTLLVSVMVTALLLLVSFVVANVALKQLIISQSSEESQYAFYNAESGMECAIFWDFEGGVSQFDIAAPGSVDCNNQFITTGSQSLPSPATGGSIIGDAPVSIFSIDFTRGCAIVTVEKDISGDTTISSTGYNTCDSGSIRRLERGVELTY